MIENTERNTGQRPEVITADAGYWKTKTVQKAIVSGAQVLVSHDGPAPLRARQRQQMANNSLRSGCCGRCHVDRSCTVSHASSHRRTGDRLHRPARIRRFALLGCTAWALSVEAVPASLAANNTDNVWSICPGLVKPQSRGYLRLNSADPRDVVEINANMLGDPHSLEALPRPVMKNTANPKITCQAEYP
ncbi:MAG TPA: hypothetical protein VHZ55_00895 [Bryobacteraceae bacterium]|nr:hypothetical protein [Bryobacteraceae bacterium]